MRLVTAMLLTVISLILTVAFAQSQEPGIPIHAAFNRDAVSPEQQSAANIYLIPKTFAVFQNFPKPFNMETTINYSLPEDATVYMAVFNILGTRVRQLENGIQSAGYHSVVWDGVDDRGNEAPSGVYLYLLEANEYAAARKMTLLK